MAHKSSSRDHAPEKLVTKSVTIGHENGPRSFLRGPFHFRSGDSVVFQDIRIGCLKTSE